MARKEFSVLAERSLALAAKRFAAERSLALAAK
jgi:hypothetical protein